MRAERQRLALPWHFTPLEDQSIAWGLMGGVQGTINGIAILALYYAVAVAEDRAAPAAQPGMAVGRHG